MTTLVDITAALDVMQDLISSVEGVISEVLADHQIGGVLVKGTLGVDQTSTIGLELIVAVDSEGFRFIDNISEIVGIDTSGRISAGEIG